MTWRLPMRSDRDYVCEPANVNGVCPVCGFASRSAERRREFQWDGTQWVGLSKSGLFVQHEDVQLQDCYALETKAA